MLTEYKGSPTVANEPKLPGGFPRLPDAILKRFPQVAEYHEESDRFWRKVRQGVLDSSEEMVRDIATATEGFEGLTAAFQAGDALLSAALLIEQVARADADGALASLIVTLEANYIAADVVLNTSITNEQTARVNADSAEATTRFNADATLTSDIGTVSSNLTIETTNRVNADSALGTRATTLESQVQTPTTGLLARVSVVETTYATDTDVASSISTVTSAYIAADSAVTSGYTAAVSVEQSARIAADGAIHAQWGVSIDVNGRIAGRINLDGTNASSTFLIAVDKFVVANANGTITAMDIRSGGKIVMGADVQSDNYVADTSGWLIERNSGNVEFGNGKFRGQLDASKIRTDCALYNVGTPANTFPAKSWQNATHSGPTGTLGAGGTEFWLITFTGWSTGSGYSDDRFGKTTTQFTCFENGGCSPAAASFVDLEIIYRVNGGATTQVTPYAVRALPGNGSLNVAGGIEISGLAGTDAVEFGVRAKSPDAASTLNVSNLTVECGNL